MKKVLCILAVTFVVSWASAQTSGSSDQTSTGEKATHKSMHKGSAATLTGCLSGPNDEGAYVLEHGSKKVEVGGNDELSKHVGHTVKLHGTWSTGSAIGEKESSEKGEAKEGKEEKGERHFKVTSIDHVSDTCQAGAAGTMGGHKHKKGAAGEGATPQPSPSPSL